MEEYYITKDIMGRTVDMYPQEETLDMMFSIIFQHLSDLTL